MFSRLLVVLAIVTCFEAYGDGPIACCEENQQGCDLHGLQVKAKKEIQAQIMLGKMYWQGKGVKQNDAQAYDWFKKAANQGSLEAMYYLGQLCEEGRGVYPESLKLKAVRWYKKAADKGHKKSYQRMKYLETHFPEEF